MFINFRYNQLFLIFSTLVTIISVFLFYTFKDIHKIKEDIKKVYENLSANRNNENFKINQVLEQHPIKSSCKIINDDEVKKINKDIENLVKEIDDDEEEDKSSIEQDPYDD